MRFRLRRTEYLGRCQLALRSVSAQVIMPVSVTCGVFIRKGPQCQALSGTYKKNTPKHTMHGIHLCIAVRLELIVLEMLLSLLVHLPIRAVAQHEKCHCNQKASDDRGHRK